MSEEHESSIEKKPEYWNFEFERKYGDLLVKAVRIKFPGITEEGIENEADVFYYKLKVLQWLIDPSVKVGSPSRELFLAFGSDVLVADEFVDFDDMAALIRKSDQSTNEILTDTLLEKCQNVIEKPSIVSFYFNFGAPKKSTH